MKGIQGSGFRVQGEARRCSPLSGMLVAILVGIPFSPLMAQSDSQAGETPAPQVLPEREAEESAFREGLRQRGLDEWLDEYLAATPPVSVVDGQLRRREALLAQATAQGTTRRQRQQLVVEASHALSQLIEKYPDHPARAAWRMELVRDRLEREDPAAFDAVLLYELPGRDRAAVAKLSGEAITALKAVRADVAAAWKKFEGLDEREMAKAAASGATRSLELLDGQSAFLMAWAEFYQAISAEVATAERDERLRQLLEAMTDKYGWTAQIPGREVQRASALAMAAVALRLTGRYPEADRAARTISDIVSTLRDPAQRQSLDQAVLLAVLEQVRGPRDAGKLDDARAILDEARKWAGKQTAGNVRTELALAMVERSVLARQMARRAAQAAPTAQPSVLAPAEALLPLQRVTAVSPAARDAVYEALAGAIGNEAPGGRRSPFELQLLAGAMIADAVASAAATSTQPARDGRGLELAAALGAMAAHPPAPIPEETRGELLFLQARGYYLGGAPLAAVRALCELVEQCPQHDRAEAAARQATAVAQEVLRNPGGADPAAARLAFVRAGRMLRKRSPESAEARQLQYFIASALDEAGRHEEAAEEYGKVPPNDTHALRAARARARCLMDALLEVTATRPAEDADAKDLAGRALAAARAAAEKASSATGADPCVAADITLLLAGILNHPSVTRYEEAAKVLEGFESRHANCPPALALALRERVTALRQLKRMGEARAAMEEYLKADADNAGPLMARLLDAMRDEIHAAADRGDADKVKTTADEAAKLAERLLDWAKAHPGRLGASETLTVAVWRAWAMQQAGRAKEALAAYEQAAKAPPEALPANSALRVEIRLGQAECLLALDGAADALTIFNEILGQVPEQSPNWWRAYVGTLSSHSKLKHDAEQIVQSIRQQRKLHPELGGAAYARELKRIEEENTGRQGAAK